MIKNPLLLLFFLLFYLSIGFTQPNSFFMDYGGEYNDNAFALTLTSNNEYVFVGRTGGYDNLASGLWLVKTDNSGALVWQKSYGYIYGVTGLAVQETHDGGFIAGGIQGKPDTFGHGYAAAYVIRTNSEGDSLWTFVWNEDLESRAQITSLQQISDSIYIVAGTTNAELNSSIPPNAFLIALDDNGNELWTKIYDNFTRLRVVTQTLDGGYFFGGGLGIIGATTQTYLVKTDAVGDTLWTLRSELGLPNGLITSVLQNNDGSFITAGIVTENSDRNAFVSKLDETGNLLWTKQYGGIDNDFASEIVSNGQEGYTFVGYTGNNTTGPFDPADIWLVNLDGNGDTLWTKTYGTEDPDIATGLKLCPDGGFIITGYDESEPNAFLVKTDSLGNVDFSTAITNPRSLARQEVFSFPNPASAVLSVNLPTDFPTNQHKFSYLISDLSGTTIRQSTVGYQSASSPSTVTIDIVDLNSGFYFITFSSGKKHYWSKFIKQ